MALKVLRKYGESATLNFVLFTADGEDFEIGAVYAAGDVKIMKDEGTEVNTTNGFTDEGTGYAIVLTAIEMEATRIVIYISDQTTPNIWLDDYIIIETYGHVSAQFPNYPANVIQWRDTDIPAPDSAGYPISTIKDGDGQGEILTTAGRVNEVLSSTICDCDESRDVVAKALKSRDVSSTGDVTGSIYKDLKTLINTIPASTLTQTVDTETVGNILELTMAMVNGRFKKNIPSEGKITFYKRDNVTPLFIVTVTELERTLDP